MDVLLLQFCTVALDNMEETIFIKIAEQFNVLNGIPILSLSSGLTMQKTIHTLSCRRVEQQLCQKCF